MSAPARDWSLKSGERQTAAHFAEADAAHRARYAWAAGVLGRRPTGAGADVFSATGYGTAHLAAETGMRWHGYEGSAEAVSVAARAHPRIVFSACRFPCPLPVESADAVVSLESIEHVEEDRRFVTALALMLKPGGDLLVSVPNEERIPCADFGNPFHVRHYTPATVLALFDGLGLELVGRYGQRIHRVRETAIGPQRQGRVPDAEQEVAASDWSERPCVLLAHYRRVA